MFHLVWSTIKLITIDIVGDILYWPVWWYTAGLKDLLNWAWRQEVKTWQAQALGIWLRNMFTPMYDDRSILGRGISFVMRLVLLAWKLGWFIFWSAFVAATIVAWVAGPVGVGWMIGRQFSLW